MADVDITSLSVEISAESQGAELNIDKLTTAISKLRTKGSIGKVCASLDTLTKSISALKSASSGMDGLSRINDFMDRISNVNLSESAKGIRSVASALTRISSVDLKGIDLSGLKSKMNSLQNGLSPLSKVDASSLRSVSSALNSIAKIPDFSSKLDSKTLDDFATSCKKITDALDPLASKIETVGNSFAKLPSNIQKVIAATDGATKASSKSAKSYLSLSNQLNGFMRNMAKLVSLKAIADYLGNAAEKFNSYYEAANLFGVSMKGLTGEASTFINKMETLLGIDPTEAMNNMATIQGLTTSFGMASDKAYVLSKNLTQLGYDLASLKNIPVAESFTKIQAAISGELEPIRRLGVDISNARLQQELLNLGYSQSVSTLSQADKAVLRYIAIMKQTTDAQGDFARTLSSPANMIRILQAQLNSLARAVGSLLYPALKSILPPLIAAVELVKELITGIASLMGVKVEFPDFSSASDAVGGVTDAMDNTTKATGKAAKAFKNYIMGFDELNVIQKDNGSSGGSGSGAGAAGNILGDVDLSGYDMFNRYNEELAKQIDSIKEKMKGLLPVIGSVGAAIAAWQISKALLDGIEKLKSLTVNVDFDINWSTLGIVAFMADMDEFKRYLDDFIKNGASFNNVVGMISEFAGMMGDALLLLGNLQWAGALKTVQGVLEIVNGIKDIADNGANVDNVTTVIRGLTNIAFAVGLFTKNAKLAGAALVIQGFTTIIREIADNWDAIKNGDWSGVDKATLATAAIEALGGIAVALGVFSKFKKAKEAADSVEAVKSIASATESIKESTSGLSPNLVGIVKNLGLGVAIVAEISAAAILFTGAIAILGNEMKAVGEAWQPVIDNAKMVAEGIGLGTVALAAVGAGAATLGSIGGVSLAANIGIGTGILAEVGAAAVLYEAEIWAIGTGLDKIQQAWKPVNNNGSEIAKDIGIGTAVLVGIGAATAAIGAVTVASAGTIPIAIGIGTAVLVECAAAFVGLTESVSGVANSLTDTLYPSLKNLNSKLPSIKTGMSKFTGYLKDFANEISSYTKSMGSVTWSSVVGGFQKLFAGNPIAKLSDDVATIYSDSSVLNGKLSVANPELSKAVQLLTDYNSFMSQLKLLTDGASNTTLATDIFTNLKDCGEKLVTGFVSGIDSKLPDLNIEVGQIKTALGAINDEKEAFKKAGGYIIQGLIDGLDGKKEDAYRKIVEIGNALADKFAKAMDINSPSKLFKGYGVYLIEGLANGISAAKDLAVNAIQSVSDAVKAIGSQLADENYGLGNGSISLSIDASGKSMMETANALKRSVRTTNDSFGGWFKKMKTDLGDFTEGINAVTKAGKDISNGFKSSIDALTAASKSILNTHDGFVSAVSDIRSFVKKSVAEIENEYQYNGFFGAAGLAIQKAFEGVYLVFDKVSTAIKNVSDTIDSVKNVITTFNNLKTKVGEVIDQVPALKQAYGGLKSFFSDLFDKDSGIGKFFSDSWDSILKGTKGFLNQLGIDFSDAWESLGIKKGVKTLTDFIFKAFDTNWGDILKSGLNFLKQFGSNLGIGSGGSSGSGSGSGSGGDALKWGKTLLNGGIAIFKAVTGDIPGAILSTLGAVGNVAGDIFGWVGDAVGGAVSWVGDAIGGVVDFVKGIFGFASGGFPDAGQLFIAREAGAEMVGSMGGHTAVANNDQIVEGIREGVEAAMERQNQLLRRQNELLQALLEKEGSAEVNVSSFYQAVNRTNQRNGKTIIPVGT